MSIKTILRSIIVFAMMTFGALAIASEGNIYGEDNLNIAADAKHPEFVIKLKSNPTTGYAWFLREYNHNLLIPVKHQHQAPATKLIGAPGYELWTFRLKPAAFVVPQQMIIRFVYARPWQGAENSTQVVFRVTTTK